MLAAEVSTVFSDGAALSFVRVGASFSSCLELVCDRGVGVRRSTEMLDEVSVAIDLRSEPSVESTGVGNEDDLTPQETVADSSPGEA